MESVQATKLRRNLILLAGARGLIFWYGIEKLFELEIGITVPQIVLLGVIAQGSKLVFELPSSIVADKWSRRNTLMSSGIAMIVCCLVLALSKNFTTYVAGILLWSLSDALASGVYEAFIYDSMREKKLKTSFRKLYSRLLSVELFGLAASGIAAGFLAQVFNLQLNFFITVVPMFFLLLVLFKMEEPKLERSASVATGWASHIGNSFRTLLSKEIRFVTIMYVAIVGIRSVWYEYYQLVGIDVKTPLIMFGFMIAIATIGLSLGAELVHRFEAKKSTLFLAWGLLLGTHIVGLRFANLPVALLNMFLVFVSIRMLQLYFEVYIQENIESKRRATILSLAATLGYGWFLISGLVFRFILPHIGVRSTVTWMILPLTVLAFLDFFGGFKWVTKVRQKDVERVTANE